MKVDLLAIGTRFGSVYKRGNAIITYLYVGNKMDEQMMDGATCRLQQILSYTITSLDFQQVK